MSVNRLISLILVVAVTGSGIGVVYARHESRQLFVQLQNLEKERDELNIEFGRLQLEQATLAEANNIEQIARGKLGLISPGMADIIILKNQ